MNTQIIATFLQVFLNYLIIYRLDLGLIGLGISTLITNAFILALNMYQTAVEPSLKQSQIVSILDARVYTNLRSYLQISFPNICIILLDWTCFQNMVILAGYFGLTEQAS